MKTRKLHIVVRALVASGFALQASSCALDEPASGTPSASALQAGPDCKGGSAVDFALVGWATQAGGTTGGKGGSTVTVRSGAELARVLKDKAKNTAPLTILVEGTITAQGAGVSKFDVKEVKNVSIIGARSGATLEGIGLKIVKSSNVVVRNLRIRDVRTGDKDAISIEGPADHIWIDHCELEADLEGVDKDYYDGLLDAKKNAQYITYSWNYLHDSWKASLVGSSESDTFDRKLTMHHNFFERVNSRLPLFRGGNGHVFNNYYKDVVDTAINSRIGACLRVEGNVFSNVENPWISAFSDELGGVELSCNAVVDGSKFSHDDERREPRTCRASVPYDYSRVLNHVDRVAEVVRANAGIGKLKDPTVF